MKVTSEQILADLKTLLDRGELGPVVAKTFPDGRLAEVWPMTMGKGRIIVLPYDGSLDVLDGW